MTFEIELPDELQAALKQEAHRSGVSEAQVVRQILQRTLIGEADPASRPYKTGYGMWAKYGPAPSAEEIEENRREIFRSFARDIG